MEKDAFCQTLNAIFIWSQIVTLFLMLEIGKKVIIPKPERAGILTCVFRREYVGICVPFPLTTAVEMRKLHGRLNLWRD